MSTNNKLTSDFVYSNLDIHSIQKLCGKSNQVMVYGWSHCFYSTVKTVIDEAIKNYEEGNLRGRRLASCELIYAKSNFNLGGKGGENTNSKEEANKLCKRHWKEGLTNTVLENCKRKKMSLPLVIVIFCVDVDGNPYPKTIYSVTSLVKEINTLVTNAELRRCYKLCHNLEPDVCAVAKDTFKFAALRKDKEGKCILEKVLPFWEESDWNVQWSKRILEKRNGNLACAKSP